LLDVGANLSAELENPFRKNDFEFHLQILNNIFFFHINKINQKRLPVPTQIQQGGHKPKFASEPSHTLRLPLNIRQYFSKFRFGEPSP